MGAWAAISQIAGPIINAGLGLALEDHNDRRQLNQERDLSNMQIEQNDKQAAQNEKWALDQWKKTGPVGQMQQLTNAGLNPGLMYSGGAGGGGGTTAQPVNTPQAHAPQGGHEVLDMMQMGMALQLQKAQIDNIKANTEKTQAEIPNVHETGHQIVAQTNVANQQAANIAQATSNAQVEHEILEWEKGIKSAEATVATKTIEERITNAKQTNDQLAGIIKGINLNNSLTEANKPQLIQQARLTTTKMQLDNLLTAADVGKTQAETDQIRNSIQMAIQQNMREWDKMSQENQRIALDRTETQIHQQLADLKVAETIAEGVKDILLGAWSIGPGAQGKLPAPQQKAHNIVGFQNHKR